MKAEPRALDAALLRPSAGAGPRAVTAAAFERPAPLALELGFGGGEALAWWAQRRPEWNFLGFERAQESVARAARRITEAGLAGRVRLIHGDARHLLRECVPVGAAVRALMQFPMPWPKARHAKHRLTDSAFIAGLASALARGGRFELVTDQEGFARELAAGLLASGRFSASAPEPDPPRAFRTRYELRWLVAGRRIWRLRAELRAPAPAAPLSRPDAMDHLHLDPPEPQRVRALAGLRAADALGTREIQEVFAAEDGWLLRGLAADGGFAQRFFLRLSVRTGADALLRVDDCGRPYLTPAVLALLEDVRAALVAPTCA